MHTKLTSESDRRAFVRQRSLMLLQSYRREPTIQGGPRFVGRNLSGPSTHKPSDPNVEQTAAKYGCNKDSNKSITVATNPRESLQIDNVENPPGTSGNTYKPKCPLVRRAATPGVVRQRKMLDRRTIPAVVNSSRATVQDNLGSQGVLTAKAGTREYVHHHPNPASNHGVPHKIPEPDCTLEPRLRLTHHPDADRKNVTFHHHKQTAPSVHSDASERNYLHLETTELKIKDFLRRTSAVVASRSHNDIMEKAENIRAENSPVPGFVGPEERKRQFSKVYHLEPPHAMARSATDTSNTPVSSSSSANGRDRADSPIALPPLILPPIRQADGNSGHNHCGTAYMSSGPEKSGKPLSGREWRKLKKCRYLRLGQYQKDSSLKELSVQEMFPRMSQERRNDGKVPPNES